MTRRVVAVLVPAPPDRVGGFPDHDLRLAMVEDVYETVAALELVEPALVVTAGDPAAAALEAMTWPGTTVHTVLWAAAAAEDDDETQPTTAQPPTAQPTTPPPASMLALRLLESTGAEQVTLVSGDTPDLPGLLVGKLHRALGSADVAVLPAADGGLVAVAVRCPLADWVVAADDIDGGIDDAVDGVIDMDADDATARLQARAPRRTAVSIGPGWHRVRAPADLARLDPGLEGWEVTRALLRR